MTTETPHPFSNFQNLTSRLQQTIQILQSWPCLRYNNAREVIESNYAAKAFRLLLMKRYSVSHRCILIKSYLHSEIAPFPLSFFHNPHRQSTWQMASTTSILENSRWTSRMTAEQMDSVCPPLIVRRVSSDQVVKVLLISVKAILACHLAWMHVKRLWNHTSQQLNSHHF